MRKYITLVAGVVLQGCLGGVYAWSVFVPGLRAQFGYSAALAQLTFGVTILVFSASICLTGLLVDRWGPRRPAVISGLLLMAGYECAGLFGDRAWGMLLGNGVLNGLAIGFGYLCALAAGLRWFPRHKGLVSGLAVAGYGGGALALSILGQTLLSRGWEVRSIFRAVGLIYGPLVITAGLLLFTPGGWMRSTCAAFNRRALWRDRGFWALVVGMGCGTWTGLSLIGVIKPMALHYGMPAAAAVSVVGMLALGNAVGRVGWGWLQDRIGERRTLHGSFAAITLSALALPAAQGHPALFLGAVALLGFAFGGCMAIYPAQTAHRYGAEHLGAVYPLVLAAHGLAALSGPWLCGLGYDLTGSYAPGIALAVTLALLGWVGTTALRRSRMKREPEHPVPEVPCVP